MSITHGVFFFALMCTCFIMSILSIKADDSEAMLPFDGCYIEGEAYPSGHVDFENRCRICDPNRSRTQWSVFGDKLSINDVNVDEYDQLFDDAKCLSGHVDMMSLFEANVRVHCTDDFKLAFTESSFTDKFDMVEPRGHICKQKEYSTSCTISVCDGVSPYCTHKAPLPENTPCELSVDDVYEYDERCDLSSTYERMMADLELESEYYDNMDAEMHVVGMHNDGTVKWVNWLMQHPIYRCSTVTSSACDGEGRCVPKTRNLMKEGEVCRAGGECMAEWRCAANGCCLPPEKQNQCADQPGHVPVCEFYRDESTLDMKDYCGYIKVQ